MSFKRRLPATASSVPQGTRLVGGHLFTSTGIPSFDDILGGGVPINHSVTVLAPNEHASYSDLIHKHYIAQGLLCEHKVVVIDPVDPLFPSTWPWPRNANEPATAPDTASEPSSSADVRIAWRYRNNKEFKTTVETSHDDIFSYNLELVSEIASEQVASYRASHMLVNLPLQSTGFFPESVLNICLDSLETQLGPTSSNAIIRICLRNVGSLAWGCHSEADIIRFFYRLRWIVRNYPNVCALISLSAWVCDNKRYGAGWVEKMATFSDACVTFDAFSGDLTRQEAFPNHHGVVQIHKLPMPNALVAPSDRLSQLRGLSASGQQRGGENNLAFRCTRRRFVIETLHLDAVGKEEVKVPSLDTTAAEGVKPNPRKALGVTAVAIELEAERHQPEASTQEVKPEKKSVGFRVNQPELYEY